MHAETLPLAPCEYDHESDELLRTVRRGENSMNRRARATNCPPQEVEAEPEPVIQ